MALGFHPKQLFGWSHPAFLEGSSDYMSWKGKISVQDETLWAVHSGCALKVCVYLWHFQENVAEISSATADLFLRLQSIWFLRKKGPIDANFPLSQNKEPNAEGISSMPCMAMSNIPCNAAALRWGREGWSPVSATRASQQRQRAQLHLGEELYECHSTRKPRPEMVCLPSFVQHHTYHLMQLCH